MSTQPKNDQRRSEQQRNTPLRQGRGQVSEVCVVHEVRPGWYHQTAIDKRPVDGTVRVTQVGVDGDRQIDRSHGGRDAAVYVYAAEDAEHFAASLGRDLPAGTFGENLRTTGLDVTGARLGERWQIGDVLLEVRKPRTPCLNLSKRIGVDGFHLEFNSSGRVGAMCAVLATGEITAGDGIRVVHRPDHPVTVGSYAVGIDPGAAAALLESGESLPRSVREKAKRATRRR